MSDSEVEGEICGFQVLGEWNCVQKRWHGKHTLEVVVDDVSGFNLGAKIRLVLVPDPQGRLL